MKGFSPFVRRVIVLATLGLLVAAFAAQAAGPVFMAGFPLRAGENVMLMWMPFPGATAYNVYRSGKSGGPYQKLGSAQANSYMDANAPADQTHYYVVKPVVGGKEGEASAEVSLARIEPMKTPDFLGFLVTADGKVALRWEASTKAAFYNLFRADTEKGNYKLLSSLQDTRYTDGDVARGKTYYYKVTAVSASNVESAKAEKPYPVKVEKVETVVEKAVEVVRKPVEEVNTYDVDEKMVLRTPRDIALDGQGNFFVVDGRGFVQYVSKEFKFMRAIGERPDKFEGNWGYAEGVCYDGKVGELYVTYKDSNLIRVYDRDGKLLRSFQLAKPDPKTAPEQGEPPTPLGITMGPDGNLWIVDAAYFQIVVLTREGAELRRVSLPRNHKDRKVGDGNLVAPSNIAVSPKNGNVYVLEVPDQRVTVFDKDGKFVGRLGGRGAGPGRLLLPAGIAVDGEGNVYVGDRNLERLQSFDPNGAYQATYVKPKIKDPQKQIRIFPGAYAVAVDGGNIYYTNHMGEKVVVYKIVQ